MKIESYKAATPLVKKIETVDAFIKDGEQVGSILRLSILNQNGSKVYGSIIDVSKVEDLIGVGLWDLLCDYQKYLHEKLEKL